MNPSLIRSRLPIFNTCIETDALLGFTTRWSWTLQDVEYRRDPLALADTYLEELVESLAEQAAKWQMLLLGKPLIN